MHFHIGMDLNVFVEQAIPIAKFWIDVFLKIITNQLYVLKIVLTTVYFVAVMKDSIR